MAEMTAVEYLKAKARMGKIDEYGICTANCFNCPLSKGSNGTEVACMNFGGKFPEKAVSIVQKWAEEHPVKTMMQDFFEKHPNAPRKGLGEPIPCISTLGYKTEGAKCCESCFECWNRPLEE
ncbi:hypothetical protein [Anaerotignum sp.]